MAVTAWLTPTSTGDPNNDWASSGDPTRAYIEDDISVTANGIYQDYGDFGLPLFKSNTVIDGIQIRTKGLGSVSPVPKCGIEISWNGGLDYTSTGKQTSHSGSDKGLPFFSTVGSITDKWGRTWGVSDFTASNFRIRLQNAVQVFSIDVLEIKIFYTENPFMPQAKGTLRLNGFVNRKYLAERSIEGELSLFGFANAIRLVQANGIEDKKFLYKIYNEDGSFYEVWNDVISEFTVTKEINELGSSVTIELARNSDSLSTTTQPLQAEDGTTIITENDLPILVSTTSKNQVGPGSSVQHNNRVDIYVFYGVVEPLLTESGEEILTESGEPILASLGAPNGRRIFTGFISDISSRYGSTETTVVQVASYGYDLSQFPITDSGGKTTVTFNSLDPSTIAQNAIDKFVTDSSGYGTYTHRESGSIPTTGTVVSYTFKANSYADVLKKVLELMPSNWYFYVGLGDNVLVYRERRVQPHHLFYLGKHINALEVNSTILGVQNDIIFTGGGTPTPLFKRYTETPAPRTRRGLNLYSDSRVELADSAQIISDGIIENSNKIQYRSTIKILSKQYDIESINPGDTIGFRNFGNYVDELTMQVVGLTYEPDIITLQLDSKPVTVNKRLEDLRRNQIVNENKNVPDQPT